MGRRKEADLRVRSSGSVLWIAGLVLAVGAGVAFILLSGPRGTNSKGSLLNRGRKIYEARCARCHGIEGDGKGRYAEELDTAPADFTRGVFKFRSTPSGSLPTDEDLMRTLERGVRGTAMLPWPSLSRREKRAVIARVKSFSSWFEGGEPPEVVNIPPPPEVDQDLLRRGRVLYLEAGCAKCHGEEGRGDGPRAGELTDDLGRPVRPPDLTRGLFKTGGSVAGIYRTLVTGLDGTPMPSQAEAYTPEQLWAISYYVRSLGPRWPDWGRGMIGMMRVMSSRFVTPDERRGMRIDRPAMGGAMGPFALSGSLIGRMADGQGMGMGDGMGWGWGMAVFGLLFWVAVFVLVVLIIWRLLPGRGTSSDRNEPTALEILERRYAQGQINREEFEEKKQDLRR